MKKYGKSALKFFSEFDADLLEKNQNILYFQNMSYDLQKLHTFFLILKHCEQGGGPTKTSFYCYNKKNSIIG